eukprot:TRINITY_DN53602_c0_g1_i1.p1 TRINITY_DN53602_c0_g1~~TRINITY_DN53602_c0_g1_i1.p1  ORF type:complete len:145 (-),score=14.99 TRINITY_DN53602_c0_g1_i1:32-466(-)
MRLLQLVSTRERHKPGCRFAAVSATGRSVALTEPRRAARPASAAHWRNTEQPSNTARPASAAGAQSTQQPRRRKATRPASAAHARGTGQRLAFAAHAQRLSWSPTRNADQRASALSTVARQRPCLLYTSPSPRDRTRSRMPSSA